MQDLGELTDAVEAAGKSVILINPVLKDIPGAAGVMGISGREGRMKFAESFEPVYHFRLLYVSGTFYPIKGALRKTFAGKWQVLCLLHLRQPVRAATGFSTHVSGSQRCGRSSTEH
jgi:adenylate kinase